MIRNKFVLFAASFFILLNVAKAQTNNSTLVLKDRIIGLPSISLEQKKLVKEKLLNTRGIIYKGFCEDQQCFLINVDENIFNDEKITELILSVDKELKIFIKQGTAADLEKECADVQKLYSK